LNRALVRLHLEIDDIAVVDVSAMASFPCLTDLSLYFPYGQLDKAVYRAVGGMTQLRHLSLWADNGYGAADDNDEITDEDLTRLVANMPHLESLSPSMSWQLTNVTLETLGVRCPLMADLVLPGPFALDEMDITGRGLFPNIRTLSIECLPPDKDEDAGDGEYVSDFIQNVVDTLEHHFLMLEELDLRVDDHDGHEGLDKAIHALWRSRLSTLRREPWAS
jgi:hypothetical protein